MRLTQYINESINDKALLKAVFFVGYPGSGKTTISRLVTDGSLPISVVSSDIWTEFFGDHKGRTEWSDVGMTVKSHTATKLKTNTDGLLPIFVDTTGAAIINFTNRVNILKDIGYDLSMVIVDVEPETSVERVSKRNKSMSRQVDTDFLLQAHDKIKKVLPQFKKIIPDNITVKNDNLTDADILKAYRQVVKFFNKPVKNEKGKKLIDYMKKNGYKYYREIPEDWKTENGYPDITTNSMKWFNKT